MSVIAKSAEFPAFDQDTIDDAIASPKTYANPALCDDMFSYLRQHDPLHWSEPKDYRPFWAVTRHSDIMDVERNSTIFANAPRAMLRPIEQEELNRKQTGGSPLLLRSLISMDPPDHVQYRRLAQAWFSPQRIKPLQEGFRALACEALDAMNDKDGACDFARDVAAWYPLRAVLHILGVPREDHPKLLRLSQEIFGVQDEKIRAARTGVGHAETVAEFASYFKDLTAKRRANPTDDLASVISNAQINDQPMGDRETLSYYILIATAGHDSTSSSIAGGLLALMQNPEQFAKLRADRTLLPQASEEMVRWVTPVKHFFRTALSDCEVRGKKVREGDGLMLCYPSGNRDEDAIENPFTFDVCRQNNRHVAFGYGPHVCLGKHMALLEIGIFFEELMKRVENISLAGEPQWLASSFVSGLTDLPVRYTLK